MYSGIFTLKTQPQTTSYFKSSNLRFFIGENQLCVHHHREARGWSATPKNPFLFAPNFMGIQFWQKPEQEGTAIPLPPQKDIVGEATTPQSHCPGLLSTAPAPYSPKAGTHRCHLRVLTSPFTFPSCTSMRIHQRNSANSGLSFFPD